jgi:hypothetical protein
VVGVEDLAFKDEGKGLAGVVWPMGANIPKRTDAVWAKENLTDFEQVKLWIFNFNSSKLVFEPLVGLNLKSHEYLKFITHKDLKKLFRSFLHLTKC